MVLPWGPFDIACIVDLGPTRAVGAPPESEDVEFHLRNAVQSAHLGAQEFLAVLEKAATPGLSGFGPVLRRNGRTMVVPEGKGDISLAISELDEPFSDVD